MMAIARWEKPTDSLVAKGLMERADRFNNFITPAGRAAIEVFNKQDDDNFRQVAEGIINVRNARVQSQISVEQAAQHLAHAARASHKATGDTLEHSAREWAKVVLEKALELLR